MSEGTKKGTKIGEFKDNQEFSAVVKRDSIEDSALDLSSTKIGKVSEFEKNLGLDFVSDDVQLKEREVETDDLETDDLSVNNLKKPLNNISSEMSFADVMETMVMDYQEGDIIKGTVRSIEKSGVLVDINYKSDGFISNAEFSNDPEVSPSDVIKVGDEISVFIEKLESKEGYIVLSRKKIEYEEAWTRLMELTRSRKVVAVKITSKVQGGLVAEYYGIKGFIPASQVIKGSDESLDIFCNQVLDVVVLKASRRRRKIIFSHKLALHRSSESRDEVMKELEVGQVREGTVSSIKDFGVFIDLGGLEGLVHISELSWSHVSRPSDVVRLGEVVKVFVLGVDKDTGRISLGMKQLEPDPWVKVCETYEVGQIKKGRISRITPFGAFITVDENLEGLIHISELSYDHVNNVESIVKVGDIVSARIIKLLPEEQKIGFSLKGLKEEAPEDDSLLSVSVSSVQEDTTQEDSFVENVDALFSQNNDNDVEDPDLK